MLSFWVAYILTRPLGANIGDWLGLPTSEQGLGLGTFGTSLIFLGAILATVVYLSVTRADVIEDDGSAPADSRRPTPQRETISLARSGRRRGRTVVLLTWANAQPHVSAPGRGGPGAVVLRRRR